MAGSHHVINILCNVVLLKLKPERQGSQISKTNGRLDTNLPKATRGLRKKGYGGYDVTYYSRSDEILNNGIPRFSM